MRMARRGSGLYLPRYPFLGNYEFGNIGNNDWSIPQLDGTEVPVHWNDIQPTGPNDWVDEAILYGPASGAYGANGAAPWINAGKKVTIRIHTAQLLSGGNSDFISTPPWVFSNPYGARYVWDGSLTVNQQNQAPIRWDTGYLAAIQNFAQMFAKRYDGAPWLTAIEVPLGSNSESKCGSGLNNANELTLWTTGPYFTGPQSGQGTGTSVSSALVTPWSNALWWSTVQTILGYFVAAFHRTPLVAMINDSSFSPVTGTYDITGMANSVHGWYPSVWGQNNGLTAWQTLTTSFRQFFILCQEPVHNSTTAGVGTLAQLIQQAILNNVQILYWFNSDVVLDQGNGSPMLNYAASFKGH